MKILVVDDDKEIVQLLEIYIRNEGYEPLSAYDGKEALTKLNTNPDINLVILDLMMPEMDGMEVIKQVRKDSDIPILVLSAKTADMDKIQGLISGAVLTKLNTNPDINLVILDLMMPEMDGMEVIKQVRKDSDIPILVLSAKTADMDKIQGLISGADDYVTKPFNPLEVMARVKSLLRRTQGEVTNDQPDVLNVGPLIINKDSHEVKTIKGDVIQLTALEFGILYLLASHPNRVFSADDIFERVWQQESVVSAKTVMVHVSHLRDKIEEATNGEKVIQTVWGVGYKVESH